jgi:excisionase family DNA binding protein
MLSSSTRKEALKMPEQRSSGPAHDTSASQELTLSEAAQLFNVSLGALRRLVTVGGIDAYKVSGLRGREWRVSSSTLRAAGYQPRVIDLDDADGGAEVRRLREALISERARSTDLDRRLGYALLTVGRLRGRLRDAGIDPDELFGADLEGGPEAGR